MTSTSDPRRLEATAGGGVERRRQLRQQRRQEQLRNLWRILLLTGAATGLGVLLLRQGWVLHSPDQIEISGSRQVNRDQVMREGQLQLPLQLLSLRPRQLAERLSLGLPVEQVQVSRLMLPPRLRIELVDREAVARAQRRGPHGLEQGYVDRMGNWMTSRQQRSSGGGGSPTVQVLGWQEGLRPALAQILARKGSLGSPLQEVRFEPSGSLWLRTAALGNVELGPVDGRLEDRLRVLQHLSRELPQKIRGITVQSIDLSDPDRPELGLPAKATGGTAGNGPRPGVD